MAGSGGAPRTRGSTEAAGPRLVPILLLGHGARVMLPGEAGPVEARMPDGSRPDLFDLTDYLAAKYRRLYVVDLEGVEHNRPQLDYLQEITRDTDVWIDGGVSTADSVIDILVSGARRAVLSPSRLESPAELRRALGLSSELVLEIEVAGDGRVVRRPDWPATSAEIARDARELGIRELVVSPRPEGVDWRLVAELSASGPVWVDGSFEREEAPRLAEAHAAGGLFHLSKELPVFAEEGPPA